MIEGFVGSRRPRWERLGALLDRASTPRNGLSIDELEELARLYRQTTSDLAVARRDFPNDSSTTFINQLVTRAHGTLYREAPAPFSRLKSFFFRDLPREFRASWRYLLVAAALLFVPAFAAGLAIIVDPSTAPMLVPAPNLAEIKQGETWFATPGAARSLMASMVMTNNIGVSFTALAGGMLAGVVTVMVLVFNGLSLGGISGAMLAYGIGDQLFGFISPHGTLELSVIVISGACGLMLGKAVAWPGLQPRGEALVAVAHRSIRLLLGVLPFLMIAGLFEGFVSPAEFAWQLKVAIGLVNGILLYSYLLLVGRERRPQIGGAIDEREAL